ncbi:unnamed protein product [Brassicogethes aeneus]|uniref:Uncharacterized protein n=1 Tax=Brassicogethes aeneus TaxID=1431903 RepID=A0A9P0ARK4_BRAAE|nr:unnamed protein product [Brassicogethes aeneus]
MDSDYESEIEVPKKKKQLQNEEKKNITLEKSFENKISPDETFEEPNVKKELTSPSFKKKIKKEKSNTNNFNEYNILYKDLNTSINLSNFKKETSSEFDFSLKKILDNVNKKINQTDRKKKKQENKYNVIPKTLFEKEYSTSIQEARNTNITILKSEESYSEDVENNENNTLQSTQNLHEKVNMKKKIKKCKIRDIKSIKESNTEAQEEIIDCDIPKENKKHHRSKAFSSIENSFGNDSIQKKKRKHSEVNTKMLPVKKQEHCSQIKDGGLNDESFANESSKKKKKIKKESISLEDCSLSSQEITLEVKKSIKSKKHKKETSMEENLESNSENLEKIIICDTPKKIKKLKHDKEINDDYLSEDNSCDKFYSKRNGFFPPKRSSTFTDSPEPTVEDLFNVTSSDLQVIKNLEIQLPFFIPQLHKIATCACKITKKKKSEIEDLDIVVKTGPYTKEEDRQIKKNWLEFCQEHDWDEHHPSPFLKFKHESREFLKLKERTKFLQFLGRGLENRYLYSIYARFKRLYLHTVIKTGRFSDDEDKEIFSYITNSTSRIPFVDLAKSLNRDKIAIEKRYNYLLTNSTTTAKLKWTDEIIHQFIKRIMKVTKCNDVMALKNRQITLKEWSKIARKLEFGLSSRQLQRKWKNSVYVRLFAADALTPQQIKISLIKRFLKKKYTDWKEISWTGLSKKYEGYTADKLYSLFKNMVYKFVPKEKQDNLEVSLLYLDKRIILHQAQPRSFNISIIKMEDIESG